MLCPPPTGVPGRPLRPPRDTNGGAGAQVNQQQPHPASQDRGWAGQWWWHQSLGCVPGVTLGHTGPSPARPRQLPHPHDRPMDTQWPLPEGTLTPLRPPWWSRGPGPTTGPRAQIAPHPLPLGQTGPSRPRTPSPILTTEGGQRGPIHPTRPLSGPWSWDLCPRAGFPKPCQHPHVADPWHPIPQVHGLSLTSRVVTNQGLKPYKWVQKGSKCGFLHHFALAPAPS